MTSSIIYSFGKNGCGELGIETPKEIEKPQVISHENKIYDLVTGFGNSVYASDQGAEIIGSYNLTQSKHFGMDHISQVQAGHSHYLIVANKGRETKDIYGYGNCMNGALGSAKDQIISKPTLINFPFPIKVRSVLCNANSSFILSENGSLFSIGSGNLGYEPKSLPQLVPRLAWFGVIGAWTSPGSNCVFFQDKKKMVYAFGDNTNNCLGFAKSQKESKKVLVVKPEELRIFLGKDAWQFASGNCFSLAVVEGVIYSAGSKLLSANRQDMMGIDNGWKRIKFFSQERIVSIACGSSHSICVTTEGKIYVWGDGIFSELGLGKKHNIKDTYTPIEITSKFKQLGPEIRLSCGYYSTHVWSPANSVASLDLLSFIQSIENKEKIMRDNLIWFQIRLNIEITEEIITKIKKLTESNSDLFYSWIFSGVLPTKNYLKIRKIFHQLQIDWPESNSHNNSLRDHLYQLSLNEKTMDFVIQIAKHELKIHKFLLMARTNILDQKSQNQPINFSIQSTRILLKFLYTDRILINDCDHKIIKELSDSSELLGFSKETHHKFAKELENAKGYHNKSFQKIKYYTPNILLILLFLVIIFFIFFHLVWKKLSLGDHFSKKDEI
ncbi:regulator of chromosome condensation [Anaeramoeba flamelloides]|uniref:Regulator of chromosome condensation n=1 Tax=Anaeramoeba flamelloides TaxID=1746091 RepID=A0AAV7ZIR1_9EUKA|nr:regulator of chromosome condensation [Anaeramoeba flamelloides]